jgi:hypothetical protein
VLFGLRFDIDGVGPKGEGDGLSGGHVAIGGGRHV